MVEMTFSISPNAQYRLIAKQAKKRIQHRQKIPFNMDVIFKAFNVFISYTSLDSIMPHYRSDVNCLKIGGRRKRLRKILFAFLGKCDIIICWFKK